MRSSPSQGTARPLLALAAVAMLGFATPRSSPPDLGIARIDESALVALPGNTPPAALPENDLGVVDDALPVEHMQLVLKRSPELEAELEAVIDGLHDKTSPLFHQWLTAREYGERYGVSQADIELISQWLESHGFRVDSVPVSRMFIEFSGTAGQLKEAFHTELHHLQVGGRLHISNMQDPSIPAALVDRVVGVHGLHDFMPHSMLKKRGVARRDGRSGAWSLAASYSDFTIVDGGTPVLPDGGLVTAYGIGPADFATIYNLNPLFAAGYTGAGQTVVVVEDTNLKNTSDVATFRTAFGLSGYPGTFAQESPAGSTACGNPGTRTNAGDEGEAALDAEWAGATAPAAAVILASCSDTAVFGGLIAVENLINGATPPPIISMSYGLCESENGNASNQSYVTNFQQAAAEGVSVFVSAGDEGAASCDADLAFATQGIAVSGFASTPYNIAVGGTDFMDTYNSFNGGPALSTYWSLTNGASYSSALSYIPEIPWNDSCATSLFYGLYGYPQGYGAAGFCSTAAASNGEFVTTGAGSGGPSAYSTQPTWQTGVVGLPTKSGGSRYLPDVSLFAANGYWSHYLVSCMSDTSNGAGGGPCTYTNTPDVFVNAGGGTSYAAPSLAGIQALINQYTGSKQGNPAPYYYKLAAAEFGARGSTRCNSSAGAPASPVAPDSSCIFHDITQGDIDLPCGGNLDCFGAVGSKTAPTDYGVLSTSSTTLGPAFPATTGWDYATGLGSINAYNLVTQW